MSLKTLFKIEKNSEVWLGVVIFLLAVIYILFSLGKTIWIQWIAVVTGLILASFIFFKAGSIEYFKRKEYKKIDFNDFKVWISIILAVVVALNSIISIQSIRNSAPVWLINFTSSTGVIAGSVVGVLAIIYLFSNKR